MTTRAVLAVIFACLAPSVFANGGPIAWTGPTGTGGIAPVAGSTIRLVSERLLIKLLDDGNAYDVEADYVLSNPGPAARVLYGVPLDFGPHESEFSSAFTAQYRARLAARAEEYPRSISISVAGSKHACDVKDRRAIPVANTEDRWYEKHLVGWCVAEIEVPAGQSEIALRYRGSMDFTDASYTKSVYTEFGRRSLRYDLTPAGHWAGDGARVQFEIDRGIWAPFFRVSRPAQGWLEEKGRLVYRSQGVDLKRLGAIEAQLDAKPILAKREYVHHVSKGTERFTARASSTLEPQGGNSYGAGSVLDGKGETAWCAAHGSGGTGEWIELRIGAIRDFMPHGCWLEGYVFTPGYVKSQATWLANDRPILVRIGPCDASGGKEIEIATPDRYDLAPVLIKESGLEAFGPIEREPHTDAPACVRLTILRVAPGKARDTCVSEFRPVYNCG